VTTTRQGTTRWTRLDYAYAAAVALIGVTAYTAVGLISSSWLAALVAMFGVDGGIFATIIYCAASRDRQGRG
jgi:hypothetical protein